MTLLLIAAIVIRPFAGQWVGKYSNKTILGLSLAFWWSLRCIFCHQLNHCFLFGCFMVITFGVITTVKGTISARLIPASRRGEGISFSLWQWAAMVGRAVDWSEYGARWVLLNLAFWLCTGVAGGDYSSLIMTVPPVISHADGSTPKWASLPCSIARRCHLRWSPFYDLFVCRVSAFLALYARELNPMSAASNFALLRYLPDDLPYSLAMSATKRTEICGLPLPCVLYGRLVVLGYTRKIQ